MLAQVVMFGNKPVMTCASCGYVTIGDGARITSSCQSCGEDFCAHKTIREEVCGLELVTYCAECGGLLGSEDRE